MTFINIAPNLATLGFRVTHELPIYIQIFMSEVKDIKSLYLISNMKIMYEVSYKCMYIYYRPNQSTNYTPVLITS